MSLRVSSEENEDQKLSHTSTTLSESHQQVSHAQLVTPTIASALALLALGIIAGLLLAHLSGHPSPGNFSKGQTQLSPHTLRSARTDLWEIPKAEKKKYYAKLSQKQHIQDSAGRFTFPLASKDQQTKQYFAEYEKTSREIDWSNRQLTQQEEQQIEKTHSEALHKRRERAKKVLASEVEKHSLEEDMDTMKGFTHADFIQAIEMRKLVGQHGFGSDPDLTWIYEQEKRRLEEKYNISMYGQQLGMCVIIPTYNNKHHDLYLWNTESLLQQEYSNYKVVIVDDHSNDGTAQLIADYLKWRKADPKKYVLLQSGKRNTALENIYYAAHKYCDYGEMLMVADGDDELVGTQVYKVFNTLYQQTHAYVLYSNYFVDQEPKYEPIRIGFSEDYPSFVKRNNSYRKFGRHCYSHLRTVLSDLLLLQRRQTMTDRQGNFYRFVYDSAYYFSAMEMSCGKVEYLNDLLYMYHSDTGFNDFRSRSTPEHQATRDRITNTKSYTCIDTLLSDRNHTL